LEVAVQLSSRMPKSLHHDHPKQRHGQQSCNARHCIVDSRRGTRVI